MKNYMNRNMKIWLILATLVAVALLAAFLATVYSPTASPLEPRRPPLYRIHGDIEFFYTIWVMILLMNSQNTMS